MTLKVFHLTSLSSKALRSVPSTEIEQRTFSPPETWGAGHSLPYLHMTAETLRAEHRGVQHPGRYLVNSS